MTVTLHRHSDLMSANSVSTQTVISVESGLIKNNHYEFSRVMLIQVKATVTKRCAECRAGKLDEWTDAVSLRLSL